MAGFFLAVWIKTQGYQNSIFSKLKQKISKTQAKFVENSIFNWNFNFPVVKYNHEMPEKAMYSSLLHQNLQFCDALL